MQRNKTRSLLSLALFLLPLGLVKAAGTMLGVPGPRSAEAAAPPAAAVAGGAGGASPSTFTAAQFAARQHARDLAGQPFASSPLLYDPSTLHSGIQIPVAVDPPSTPKLPEVPEFMVKAIMSAPGGDKALINGRSYMIGEEVRGTGWIVLNINPDGRAVTLRDAAHDRTVTLIVETPM